MHPDTIVSINLTNRCNLHCRHCGNRSSTGINVASENTDEISREELAEIFSMLRREKISLIGIAGGEPLLRTDFFEIMNDIAKNGLRCMLFTNGVLLTKKKIRQLMDIGSVDTVRLSVEFPERVLKTRRNDHYHPAAQTFEKVKECADAGLSAGVNMTLMPDNIKYAQELSDQSQSAGATFFRAVPVFPFGNAADLILDESFTVECIETALKMHFQLHSASVRKSSWYNSENAVRNFAVSCGAGSHLFAIDADGTLTGCPLYTISGGKIKWNDWPIKETLRRARRKTADLQRRIIQNTQGKCLNCSFKGQCRGGCIAEWDSRGGSAGQPVCYASAVSTILRKDCYSLSVKNMLHSLIDKMDDAEMFGMKYGCIRSMPLWTVWFKQ